MKALMLEVFSVLTVIFESGSKQVLSLLQLGWQRG